MKLALLLLAVSVQASAPDPSEFVIVPCGGPGTEVLSEGDEGEVFTFGPDAPLSSVLLQQLVTEAETKSSCDTCEDHGRCRAGRTESSGTFDFEFNRPSGVGSIYDWKSDTATITLHCKDC